MTRARAEAAESGRENDLARIAEWLSPLGSPVRLRLLRFLTRPHYLEEIASHLGLTRQAARKHMDKLVAIGVVERRSGVRESGPVTEYLINPQALFLIYDEFEKLGGLRRDEHGEAMRRTIPHAGHGANPATLGGPCLWVVRGLGTGNRVPLDPAKEKEWVLGRDARCHLVFEHDPYVSNRHALVKAEPKRFVLQDLFSTNRTRLNWSPLARGGEAPLRHGDLVGVGKSLLLFWDERP